MITKNVMGILILILNAGGLGYLVYLGTLTVIDHFFPRQGESDLTSSSEKKDPMIINDDIIPEEDDLLKDMDLSDLDTLDLDDFE